MSTLIDSLAHDRHAARYARAPREAAPHARAASQTAARASLTAADSGVDADGSSLQSTRSRAGWLLIGLGLRLVMRGGDTPAQRARLIGQ